MVHVFFYTLLQIKFSDNVQWMTLEFDPRTGFAQQEDKIGELLISSCRASPVLSKTKCASSSPKVTTSLTRVEFKELCDDWERYSLATPPGVVILPGELFYVRM